jgi:hypothetical protein
MISDDYIRPLGRLCYPHYIQEDDDCETFGFSIQYKLGKDTSIRQHSDSSSLTFNFNFNVPSGQENWAGSSLYFIDPVTYKKILSALSLESQSSTLVLLHMPHCRLKR